MKIIVNGVTCKKDIIRAYECVYTAVGEIKEGRNNFMSWGYRDGVSVSVCKNKNSYTVHVGREGEV